MLGRRRYAVSTWLPPTVSPTSRTAPADWTWAAGAAAPVVELGGRGRRALAAGPVNMRCQHVRPTALRGVNMADRRGPTPLP